MANNLHGQVNCYETFEQLFISTLDKHVPLKRKRYRQTRLLI